MRGAQRGEHIVKGFGREASHVWRRRGVYVAAAVTSTGIPTLTANSFDFLGEQDGGQGSFPTAAHVGGIGPDKIS